MNGTEIAQAVLAGIVIVVGVVVTLQMLRVEQGSVLSRLGDLQGLLRLVDGEEVTLDLLIRISRQSDDVNRVTLTWLLPGTDQKPDVPAGTSLIVAEHPRTRLQRWSRNL